MLEIVRCNAVMWRKLGFMREGECDCYYGVQVLCALKLKSRRRHRHGRRALPA
jgi:hypothetical protein